MNCTILYTCGRTLGWIDNAFTPAVYPRLVDYYDFNYVPSKSGPTELRNQAKKNSCGSSRVSSLIKKIKQFGVGVNALWSDIQTNK